MKKPEKESVTLTAVEGLNGQRFVKVEMIVSYGKVACIQAALDKHGTEIAKDLLNMIANGDNT